MSLLIGVGNSNMLQIGKSFNEHHQFSGSITTTDTAASNLKYHDSNGELLTMHSNHTTGSPPNIHIDDDMDIQQLESIQRKYEYYIMPNKSQVLFYLSEASLLRIRRAGTELQITDSIHFPLLDIWEEINCDKSTTVLESYGRTVLLISTSSTSRCISGNKSEAHLLSVNDRNGDLFGYFVPGDPFLIEDNGKRTVAKIIAAESAYGKVTAWICVLEESGQEMARMEEYIVDATPVIAKMAKPEPQGS